MLEHARQARRLRNGLNDALIVEGADLCPTQTRRDTRASGGGLRTLMMKLVARAASDPDHARDRQQFSDPGYVGSFADFAERRRAGAT